MNTPLQVELRDELLRLRGRGEGDYKRDLTLQPLDGVGRYKRGIVTGFLATVQGTPPVAELLVREGEGYALTVDIAGGGQRWYRVGPSRGQDCTTSKSYRKLARLSRLVLSEIRDAQIGGQGQ